MLYNLYFNDESYNTDKERADRIITKIEEKISNNNKTKKKDLNKDEKDELLLVRQLIIKVLKYQYGI
tara:strand:- start:6275 stop:6475 length:201 start_codon:yes stop_codon:yes gene_type:complete